MLMLLVLLLVVVTFQVLAVAGNLGGSRPVLLLLIWAVLALVVGLLGQWGMFPWLASAVLCGVLVRRALERGAGMWHAALWGMLPVLVASAVPFLLASPQDVWADFQQQVESLVQVPEEQTGDLGPEERALLDRHRQLALTAGRWMLRLFPAEVAAINLFQVLGVVVLSGWLARRRNEPTAVPPVTRWRVPFAIVWPLAVSLLLLTFRSLPLTVIGLNAALVILAFLAVQGASVFLHLMGRNIPFRWRALLLALCALTALPLLLVFCTMLGAADLWVDFRKLRTEASGIAAKGGEDRWK
jgi:hypothetical protein